MDKKLPLLVVAAGVFLLCSPGLLTSIILLAAALLIGIVLLDYTVKVPGIKAAVTRLLVWLERRWNIEH